MTAFVFFFHKALKAYPAVFYLAAIALAAGYLYYRFFCDYDPFLQTIMVYIQRGLFAFALFVAVMYIGVLPDSSKLYKSLMPVRSELSIVACILILGHMIGYLTGYLASFQVGVLAMKPNILMALVIAVLLTVLVAILGITSFKRIRMRMRPKVWKRIQRWAYVFFALVFMHLGLFLIPAALSGSKVWIQTVVYLILFVAYVVLRIRKDRKKGRV